MGPSSPTWLWVRWAFFPCRAAVMAVWSSKSHDFCRRPSDAVVGGADKGPPPMLLPPGLMLALLIDPLGALDSVDRKVEVETEGETYTPEDDTNSEPRHSEDGESAMTYCAVRCFRWQRLRTSSDTDTKAELRREREGRGVRVIRVNDVFVTWQCCTTLLSLVMKGWAVYIFWTKPVNIWAREQTDMVILVYPTNFSTGV